MKQGDVHITISTPGYVGNDLVHWCASSGAAYRLFETKPREMARAQQMRSFLDSGRDWWMMTNHYASPQFALEDVPTDRPAFAALMRRPVGLDLTWITGSILEQDDDWIRTDFLPTGCTFLRRDAVEAIEDARPFEYRHDADGQMLGSGDRTLSDTLLGAGFDLWIWKRRCLNRQECFI